MFSSYSFEHLFVVVFPVVAFSLHNALNGAVFVILIAGQCIERIVFDVFAAPAKLTRPGASARLSGSMTRYAIVIHVNCNLNNTRL